jgi:hypothetical protein
VTNLTHRPGSGITVKAGARATVSGWAAEDGQVAAFGGFAFLLVRQSAHGGDDHVFGMYAYAYGFPLVMMDVTRRVLTAAARSGEYSAPINQFHRIRDFADPDFKNVVRISRNSLWSTAFVDLAAEPVVFSYPTTRGRYLVAQVMDMWTDTSPRSAPAPPARNPVIA